MLLPASAHSSAPPRAPAPGRRGARPVARVAALLLAGLAVMLGAPGTAAAHTGLAASTPATGAGLEAPPAEVTLVFTEAVAADLADVVVTAPDGTDATRGEAQVSGETVTQPLSGTGAAGAYRVAYRVVAADGHPVTGTLEFTVAAAAGDSAGAEAPGADGGEPATSTGEAAATAASPGSPAADTGGGAGWLVPVGAVALAVAGLGLLAARARAGRRTR